MRTIEMAHAGIITSTDGAIERGAAVAAGGFAFAWTALAVAAGVNVIGLVMNWFDLRYFDEAMHVVTFFAATLVVCLHLYGRVLSGRGRHGALLVFVALCIGLALGVCWEWAEWAFDHASGPQNLTHAKSDTPIDLIMHASGAAAAGLAMLWLVRPRQTRVGASVALSN